MVYNVGPSSTIVLQSEYFGPFCGKPRNTTSRPIKKQQPFATDCIASLEEEDEDPFPESNPLKNVKTSQLVAMNSSIEDYKLDIPLFLGKVLAMRNALLTLR
jgi:hypothetical protein